MSAETLERPDIEVISDEETSAERVDCEIPMANGDKCVHKATFRVIGACACGTHWCDRHVAALVHMIDVAAQHDNDHSGHDEHCAVLFCKSCFRHFTPSDVSIAPLS